MGFDGGRAPAPELVRVWAKYAQQGLSGYWDVGSGVTPRLDLSSPLLPRLKSLANRQFEVKRHVSFGRMNTELYRSTNSEPDDATAEAKADPESGGMGDATSIDVEQHKSSAIESELPEMQAHTELTELSVTGVGDAVEQTEDNLGAEVSLGGNKNGKKNKVYVALIEEDDFHEA